ncbi:MULTISPECIES: AtpZ/AtpI family protein [unclassified Romboutsia]|uniref:AtpZ/AtpI family protein n=1 Tax=unclassified Romboutsia TaxID=2626894 RepID=UPI000822BDB5|nr:MULTISPECIES: AtpZ/AtpI family protein [unclassified Romboutsia]SCI37225.1 Putative F0F1-ATPase subunit (ATPase_gene1) [uncultured Clostridium sp.]
MGKKNTYIEVAKMLSLISQLGIMMIISILGTFFVGRFIDNLINTKPIFTLIFLVIGVGGAFLSVYKTVIGYTKRK